MPACCTSFRHSHPNTCIQARLGEIWIAASGWDICQGHFSAASYLNTCCVYLNASNLHQTKSWFIKRPWCRILNMIICFKRKGGLTFALSDLLVWQAFNAKTRWVGFNRKWTDVCCSYLPGEWFICISLTTIPMIHDWAVCYPKALKKNFSHLHTIPAADGDIQTVVAQRQILKAWNENQTGFILSGRHLRLDLFPNFFFYQEWSKMKKKKRS